MDEAWLASQSTPQTGDFVSIFCPRSSGALNPRPISHGVVVDVRAAGDCSRIEYGVFTSGLIVYFDETHYKLKVMSKANEKSNK